MSTDPLDHLGRRVVWPIRRFTSAGAFVGLTEDSAILLPGREVPNDANVGDDLELFIYLDSEDRPVATTFEPLLELGQVAFLEVMALTDYGAFFDWGLGKELLVPFAEQVCELYVGALHPVGLYLDKSRRLAGTMYVSDMLAHHAPTDRRVAFGDWIEGVAWRNDPDIGLFVILEKRFVGLVPASEPHSVRRGDTVRARVATILPDGKLVLSLREKAHKEQANDADRILAVLRGAAPPRVGDHSSPEELRDRFGISKKAFKRAVGHLLKMKLVTIDRDGFLVASAT